MATLQSQNDQLLKYLESHKEGITPLEALNKFGTLRLSARVYDLKKLGYNIETIRETKSDKTYARYVLRKRK